MANDEVLRIGELSKRSGVSRQHVADGLAAAEAAALASRARAARVTTLVQRSGEPL